VGWWTLKATCELKDVDREHIASLIRQGYTEGEVVEWDEPAVSGGR
jgi:hypothetical protein